MGRLAGGHYNAYLRGFRNSYNYGYCQRGRYYAYIRHWSIGSCHDHHHF